MPGRSRVKVNRTAPGAGVVVGEGVAPEGVGVGVGVTVRVGVGVGVRIEVGVGVGVRAVEEQFTPFGTPTLLEEDIDWLFTIFRAWTLTS